MILQNLYLIIFGVLLSYITDIMTALCCTMLTLLYLWIQFKKGNFDILFHGISLLYITITLIHSIVHRWLIITLPIHFYMQGYKLLHPVYINESY